MGVPHPIPYQGSKRALAEAIIGRLPHQFTRLIEPFAGSAAISLAAASHHTAARFVLNDANEPLMALWEKIIDAPEKIAAQYGHLWEEQAGREREYYDWVRERFNQAHRPDDLLYLLARCVKASVRYNTRGEFNQGPDNRRRGAHPETVKAHVLGASALLRNKTTLMQGDYRCALACATAEDVIYMDPPYEGVCGRRNPRYSASIEFGEFVETLEHLNHQGHSYILSYDGRTGKKTYGQALPQKLGLARMEVHAGRSTQATLLGRGDDTYESLYLSPTLATRLSAGTTRGHI